MWMYVVAVILFTLAVKWYQSLFVGFENVDEMFPGPPRLPIIGNLLLFMGSSSDVFERGLADIKKYKKCARAWIVSHLLIVAIEPEEIEVVLSNTANLRKSTIYDFIIPWIGRGLLTSYGQKWKKNRKLLTPAFHFKILDSFIEIFSSNSKVLCENLDDEVGKPGFDIMDYVKLHALDNICETSMGVKLDSQHNPNSDLIKGIKLMCHITFVRVVKPWLRWDPLFNLTSLGQEQKKALEVLHKFTRSVIDQRIEERQKAKGNRIVDDGNDEIGIKKKQAFLDLLLDVVDEGHMTVQELQEEVDTFMFEGHDTITSALAFCLYNLAHHPQYQAIAYEEIREIFGDDDRLCTSDDVSKMKYLEMVVKESLRTHPSVPVIGRYVEKDIPLDANRVIPRGAEVLVAPIVVHKNPEIWERPDEFYPDHFLPEISAKRHPFAYVPFSAGPRNCIGMRFAMLEMKITISEILRKFDIRPSNPVVKVKAFVEATLQSETGVKISVVRRNVK